MNLKLNYLEKFLSKNEIEDVLAEVKEAAKSIKNKTGAGNDFLGWVDYPKNYDKAEFARIKEAAKRIQNDSEVLVVVGIGGSYLGAKAVIEALKPYFGRRNNLEILFAGNHISSTYLNELLEYIKDKEVSVNIISKSGTTTEPAIAFRPLKALLEEKYGKDGAAKRIYATTDPKSGALRKLADQEGYETYVVPSDMGGRYSVLSGVGLLPIACAGIDIDMLMAGANAAYDEYLNNENSDAHYYAAVRNALYRKGYKIELLVNYEPCLSFFSEWWKQLYAESEGKDNKGIFVSNASFSTDLHSIGQYIQEGERTLFETVINVEKPRKEFVVSYDEENLDELNYLSGKTVDYVNKQAFVGTTLAHVDGGVPNMILDIEKIDEYNVGWLIYFFEIACAYSGYTLGVNPFNQPGVEAYKKNMFALLEKPGYEELTKQIKEKVKQ